MALLNAIRTTYMTTDVSVTCKDHLDFQNMCSWRAVLLLLCLASCKGNEAEGCRTPGDQQQYT